MAHARTAATLLAGLLLGGCGLLATANDVPSSEVASPLLALAPAAVRNRAPLPACGSEDVTANVLARRCFWDAYVAGRPAEFITTRPNRSGDRFTSIYRSLGGGRAQVFHDALVRLGGGWLQVDCPGLTLTRDGEFFPDFVPGLPGRPPCVETPLGRGA